MFDSASRIGLGVLSAVGHLHLRAEPDHVGKPVDEPVGKGCVVNPVCGHSVNLQFIFFRGLSTVGVRVGKAGARGYGFCRWNP